MQKRRWRTGLAVITAAAMLLSGMTAPGGAQAAGKMKLNKKKAAVEVGQKVKLKLKRAKGKVKWKSSKKKIASVTKKGVVTGKKVGTAKITAKCKGRKFSCKVTVKKKGSLDPRPGSSSKPGDTPKPGATATPGKSPVPSGKPSAPPAPPVKTNAITFQISCTASKLGTNSDRSWTFALGDTLSEMNQQFDILAADASEGELNEYCIRNEQIPQGYTAYICRPYGYKGLYFQIYTDGDKVVGMAAISKYFQFKDKDGSEIVSSFGVSGASCNNASGLSGSGFVTDHRYQNALFKSTADYHVAAFVDPFGGHQVTTGGVYGIQVFATTDASGNAVSAKDVFETSEIFKKGRYTAEVNEAQGKELSEWAAAFRQIELESNVQGESRVADNDSSFIPVAQIHSEALAAENSSDPTTVTLPGERDTIVNSSNLDLGGYLEGNDLSRLSDRLLYGYIFQKTRNDEYFEKTYFTSEAVGNGSPDALGFLTWQLEESGAGGTYADLLKTELGTRDAFNEFYVIGGFASASSGSNFTYATLDMIGHGVDL